MKLPKKYALLFVLPTAAAFAIGFVWPFVRGVYLSFCTFVTVGDAKWVGMENYAAALSDGSFGYAFLLTAAFSVVSVILVNLAAFAVALALVGNVPGKNLFRTAFFLPNLIGGIVLGYIWQLLLDGILRRYGTALALEAGYGFWGLVALFCWQQIGYMMIIYIAGLQAVPNELKEAARIDGADRRQVLRHVTLPTVMPQITVCTFLTLTGSFKLFDQNLALTGGAPGSLAADGKMRYLTEMLALNIYNTFYGAGAARGVGQAKAVLFFLLVAVLALAQLRLTGRREEQM